MRTKRRVVTTLRVTYEAPGLWVLPEYLPTLPGADEFSVHSANITAAGRAIVDGEELEFQEMRIYLKLKDEKAGSA